MPYLSSLLYSLSFLSPCHSTLLLFPFSLSTPFFLSNLVATSLFSLDLPLSVSPFLSLSLSVSVYSFSSLSLLRVLTGRQIGFLHLNPFSHFTTSPFQFSSILQRAPSVSFPIPCSLPLSSISLSLSLSHPLGSRGKRREGGSLERQR